MKRAGQKIREQVSMSRGKKRVHTAFETATFLCKEAQKKRWRSGARGRPLMYPGLGWHIICGYGCVCMEVMVSVMMLYAVARNECGQLQVTIGGKCASQVLWRHHVGDQVEIRGVLPNIGLAYGN
jgi:hypothetical protein